MTRKAYIATLVAVLVAGLILGVGKSVHTEKTYPESVIIEMEGGQVAFGLGKDINKFGGSGQASVPINRTGDVQYSVMRDLVHDFESRFGVRATSYHPVVGRGVWEAVVIDYR